MFLFIFDNSRYEIICACDIDEALMMLFEVTRPNDYIDKDEFFNIIKHHSVETSVKLYNALTYDTTPNIVKVYSNFYELYKEE